MQALTVSKLSTSLTYSSSTSCSRGVTSPSACSAIVCVMCWSVVHERRPLPREARHASRQPNLAQLVFTSTSCRRFPFRNYMLSTNQDHTSTQASVLHSRRQHGSDQRVARNAARVPQGWQTIHHTMLKTYAFTNMMARRAWRLTLRHS